MKSFFFQNSPWQISSQKEILKKYAKEQGFHNIRFFVDNGYSGANFKTRKQSYKSKKIEKPPNQWKIFENTHEAIIDEETFARVQDVTIIYNYIGILPANSLYNIMNVKAAWPKSCRFPKT